MTVAFFVVTVSGFFVSAFPQGKEEVLAQAAKETEPDLSAFQTLPEQAPIPEDNPMTPAKISLGKQLYFDPRLSINGTIACQSCHNVTSSGTTNLPVPFGVYGRVDGDRQDPTVWNAAFKTVQFWDGRAPSLEEQAKGPLFNDLEMGTNPELLLSRVNSIPGYVTEFQEVFGAENPITVDNIVKAIAAYERMLITPNGPFDQYLKGKKDAIPAAAKNGAKLAQTTGCMGCHFGPNFSGPTGPMGQGFLQKFPMIVDKVYVSQYHLTDDLGRFDVTHEESDKHMWVVQTWRNIELTAPYFHNGQVKDLNTAVLVMGKTQLGKDLSPEQANDIVAFLYALTGKFPEQNIPQIPPTPGTTLLMKY